MRLNDEYLRAAIQDGHCPDCRGRGFLIGPRGGASQNVKCANLKCESRFNVVVFGWDIIYAERIPKQQ